MFPLAEKRLQACLVLCALWGAPGQAWPQSPGNSLDDDDLARRTFANAEQLMREGKVEQALREYDQVARNYKDSGLADDALYRIGEHYYPAESIDELGEAPLERIVKAREALSAIPADFPREETAPRALYKLGLIALEPGNPDRNGDEAFASFSSVVNIYPGSEVVDRALFGAGYADLASGKYGGSIRSFERVAERFPAGPVAAAARYSMGLAYSREDSWVRALEAFQDVRNHHPEDDLARRALDDLTLIYKTRVAPDLFTGPVFTVDPGYAPGIDPAEAKGGIQLAIDREGRAHILYQRTGRIARVGHDGAGQSDAVQLAGAVSVSIDSEGIGIVAAGDRFRAGDAIVIPQRLERGTMSPFQKISAAARASGTSIALLDEDRNEVLLYNGDASDLRVLYSGVQSRARLSGLARGEEGLLYTIDRRAGRVLEIPVQGTTREVTIDPGPQSPPVEPEAIAADGLGNLYILDRRNDAVIVNTAAGRFLQRIDSRPGTPVEFTYPSALAAGSRGEIYVYDEKRKTILRFW